MSRYARKTDDNHQRIVAALRAFGASVASLAAVGGGVPDLLVGYRGVNYLLEVKDGSKVASARKLTAAQVEWFGGWRGLKPSTVENEDDASCAIGAKERTWRAGR